MRGMVGAVIEDLRELAGDCSRRSQDVSDSLELVARVIADLQWEGRDAESFRQRFWAGLATSMLGLSDRLADDRSELLRQAWAQEEASSSHGGGYGSFVGGAISGGAGGRVAPARDPDDLAGGPARSITSTPLDLHGALFARLAALDAALRLGELEAIASLLRELGLADRIMLGSSGEPFAGHRLDPLRGLVPTDGVHHRISGEGAGGSGAGGSGASNGSSYGDGSAAGAGSGGPGGSGGSAGDGGLGADGATGGAATAADAAAPSASSGAVGGSTPAQLGEAPHPQAPEPRSGGSSPIGQPSLPAAFSIAGGLVAVGGAAAATAFATSALRRRAASGR